MIKLNYIKINNFKITFKILINLIIKMNLSVNIRIKYCFDIRLHIAVFRHVLIKQL